MRGQYLTRKYTYNLPSQNICNYALYIKENTEAICRKLNFYIHRKSGSTKGPLKHMISSRLTRESLLKLITLEIHNTRAQGLTSNEMATHLLKTFHWTGISISSIQKANKRERTKLMWQKHFKKIRRVWWTLNCHAWRDTRLRYIFCKILRKARSSCWNKKSFGLYSTLYNPNF